MDRSTLQENLVQQIIDGMDMDGLCQLAYDYLNDNYDRYSEKQLIAEVEEYYPNILEESNTNWVGCLTSWQGGTLGPANRQTLCL